MTIGLLASACFEDPAVIAGELSGTNKFRYLCDDSAAVKNCSGSATIFPSAVAKSALFRLSIDPTSSRDVDELRPISDEVVGTHAGGAWFCGTEGLAGFVAFDRGGSVVDYVHVKVETPIRLVLEGYKASSSGFDRASGTPVTTSSVRVGEKVYLSVSPLGRSGTALAGALVYSWTPAADGIVRVTDLGTPSNPSAFVMLTGVKSGTTRLRVDGAGLSTEFEVSVQ